MEQGSAAHNELVAATIVDELIKNGISIACISPGSRSTPLALALIRCQGFSTHVLLDERSSGFFALGLAKVHKIPVVVVTTSGTAAVELSPAVSEAYQSEIGLLLITADRPFELYGTGSAQTIDQTALFSGYLRGRRFIDADAVESYSRIRATISRLALEASGVLDTPGPVHLNVAFREPLLGSTPDFSTCIPGKAELPWYQVVDLTIVIATDAFCARLLSQERGLIVVGATNEPEAVYAIAELLGWPTLLDPRSGLVHRTTNAVLHHDLFLRIDDIGEMLDPEFILYFGQGQASKSLAGFLGLNRAALQRHRPVVYRGSPAGYDPEAIADGFLIGSLDNLVASLSSLEVEMRVAQDSNYTKHFMFYDGLAKSAIEDLFERGELGVEMAISRLVVMALGAKDFLFVSSSMPMRDLESIGMSSNELPQIYENRGVNGIDGIVATFAGMAVANRDMTRESVSVLIVGDLAFLYDVSFLREIVSMKNKMLIIVIDNNGGGIFSFLPQRKVLPHDEFEMIFGTPHNLDIEAIVRGFGIDVVRLVKPSDVTIAIEEMRDSTRPRVAILKSDREENRLAHDEVYHVIERTILAATY